MKPIIRTLATIDEYHAAVELQRAVWGGDAVPLHVLLTAQKNGGLALGAFAPDGRLVGLVFGFLGLTPAGELKHCSHLAAVLPELQNQRLGYRLKLAQRDYVLAQGIGLITWTYDPLESRNAALNVGRLGATCRSYYRDLYGSMPDGLNAGLPSDRFEVEWRIDAEHVAGRLARAAPLPGLAELIAGGARLLNPPRPGDLPRPAEAEAAPVGERLLIAIPPRFQAIKTADMELALAWRLQTRRLCEGAFAAGYRVTDFFHEGDQSCYLLEPDADGGRPAD